MQNTLYFQNLVLLVWASGGMVDTLDSKSGIRKDVGVRVPPCPPIKLNIEATLVAERDRTSPRSSRYL